MTPKQKNIIIAALSVTIIIQWFLLHNIEKVNDEAIGSVDQATSEMDKLILSSKQVGDDLEHCLSRATFLEEEVKQCTMQPDFNKEGSTNGVPATEK